VDLRRDQTCAVEEVLGDLGPHAVRHLRVVQPLEQLCDAWSALMISRSAARFRTWGAAPPWRWHTTDPGPASCLQRPPLTMCPLHRITCSGNIAHLASL